MNICSRSCSGIFATRIRVFGEVPLGGVGGSTQCHLESGSAAPFVGGWVLDNIIVEVRGIRSRAKSKCSGSLTEIGSSGRWNGQSVKVRMYML